MKILVTSATQMELQPFTEKYNHHPKINIQTTGIGMLATAINLGVLLNKEKPLLIIQAGIAGCFTEMELGEIVAIKSDCVADLGVQENGIWKDVFDMGLQEKDNVPFTNKFLINDTLAQTNVLNLPEVDAITINEISASPARIAQLNNAYNPTIESMEGAALHYFCLVHNIPFIQIRSISNVVGERDKSKWKMKGSINNLNSTLFNYIEKLLA